MDELLFAADASVAFMPGHAVAFAMETPKNLKPAALPTTGTDLNLTGILKLGNGDILRTAYWGVANDFPNQVQADLAQDAEMAELINFCVRSAYGKGLTCLNTIDWTSDGNPVYEAVKDPKLINWINSPQVRKYSHQALLDLFTFGNVFPELITTKDRSKIYSVGCDEAMHCRWSLMDEDGILKTVIHNRNWPYANLGDPKQTTVIPAINPMDYDLVNTVKNDKSLTKFIYPLNNKSIGRTYYQVVNWNGLRTSGWLQIAAKIPQFKLALMTNQMTIKYLIRIPNSYWPSVYKDWDKMKEADQNEAKKKKLAEINDSLTDVKNAGKSILNEVGIDPVTKEKIPGWEITVIDDKSKPGAFLEDSAEASSHKMRALGIDSTLPGSITTTSSMGAGSGSDKQLAWNINLAMIDLYRETFLEPLKFKAQFDDGLLDEYPGFTIKVRDSLMETVNGHNQTTKPAIT